MKSKFILILLVFLVVTGDVFFCRPAPAQSPTGEKLNPPSFRATRLVNLPTTQPIGENNLLFRISHRFFPAIKSGYDSYYGLNGPAFILLSLGYGIRDNLSITLSHSNLYHEFELSLQWVPFRQGKFNPTSVALIGSGSLITQKVPGEKIFRSENAKFNLQMSLSRQLTNAISFLLVPAYSSNTDVYHSDSPKEGTWALGTGGKFKVINDLSLIGEWVPVLSGYKANINGWGSGFEYKVGGHVFQVFITNCFGLTSDQFLPGGDLKLNRHEYRLGFNIFRTFWL